MFKTKIITISILIGSFLIGNELTLEEQRIIHEKVLHEFAQAIWTQAMEAKQAFNNTTISTREDPIENFATTAPRTEFIVNADISAELAAGTESAIVYVSTDDQETWQFSPAALLGTDGYEGTWGGTIATADGNTAFSYLSGVVNSEALGYDYGTITVSGSPHNINGNWPPGENMYAVLATDESGDAPSNQDIIGVRGTYKGNNAFDEDGNEYTDIEKIYLSLSLSGGCCDEGGLFGPWYLYGVGIVNPESDAADGSTGTAYAIGYGNGGFGQLYPGLLKITGDLSTGEIDDFSYLTEPGYIDYVTSGNDLHASALMSYITNDVDWGIWPNSFNGFIVLGMAVEASLDGLDVAAEIEDETMPGLMICNTTFQDGNTALELSDPEFDAETNTLSVTYSDSDGNLPWKKSVMITNVEGEEILNLDMIPDSHTYEEGVRFSATFSDDVSGGDYDALFWFADDDIESYPTAQSTLPITISGGSGCALMGDLNGDGIVNVIDIVQIVNAILAGEFNECGDSNGDGTVNVIDIVQVVNLILG